MSNKLYVPVFLLLAVMQLAGCATPSERVTLLPQPDGTPSAVVVQLKTGGSLLLDHPYMVATATEKQIRTEQTDEATIKLRYKEVFDALPARPKSYLLYFDFGNTQLTPESEKNVQVMLRDIKELPAPELVVIGHTDASGSDDVNDELSRQRAISVLNFLKAKGIDTQRVSTVGRGSREPLVKTKKGAYEARNRRVEIRLK
jgi:outer membrane protein OmpA-like peptidoglycan-associated protein